PAVCYEVRPQLPQKLRLPYAIGDEREKFRIACENPEKERVVERLIALHPDDQILIIGQYLDQLDLFKERLKVPLITGKTTNKTREKLYNDFRTGAIRTLIVSKVGNFAIDLPDASVL